MSERASCSISLLLRPTATRIQRVPPHQQSDRLARGTPRRLPTAICSRKRSSTPSPNGAVVYVASAAILRARVRCPARYELLVEIVSAPRRSAAEMGVANPAIV
jgi:hypothetical protein